MSGGDVDPGLADLEAQVDAQIEAEAARLAAARGGAGAASGVGMREAGAPTDDPFGFGGGTGESDAAPPEIELGEENAAGRAASEASAALGMDEERADLDVGPGTRDAVAAGLGRGRRRQIVWRVATAMLATVMVGLMGIVGWKLFAPTTGTPPEAGLVAAAAEGEAGGVAEGAEGAPGEAGEAGEAGGAAKPREEEAPEPSSVAESNALLFGEAVEALGSGWPEDADDRFRLLLRSDPTDRRGMAGLASTLAQQGQFEAAKVMLSQLTEAEGAEPGALLTLGLVAHRLGDTEEARRGLEGFIEAAPEDPRAEKARRVLASLDAS
jgi:TolA-binding protein